MNRRLEDKTILKVNMLGGFSLVYGNKPVPNNYSGTSKMMQLFQILLYAGREGISRGELIDRLYGREDLEDAGATLRVNIYRLRKYIQKLKCFENDDCIWFRKGYTGGITRRFRWSGYGPF
ncbi:MAG: AfsR/SARP family transcriptional regulator [Eisenbergiella sp.]